MPSILYGVGLGVQAHTTLQVLAGCNHTGLALGTPGASTVDAVGRTGRGAVVAGTTLSRVSTAPTLLDMQPDHPHHQHTVFHPKKIACDGEMPVLRVNVIYLQYITNWMPEGSISTVAGRMIADVWDKEYRGKRYEGESPLEFVKEIVAELEKKPEIYHSRGIYVGCGNGRNYLELAKTGLDVMGLDVSATGLRQIAAKEPSLASKLVCGDFLDHHGRFGYMIAIQSFQHGDTARVMDYFRKAAGMLERGGLLFVRVNAADTSVEHAHRVTERTNGGFTVLYEDGPKNGLHIHFFSREELEAVVADSGLRIVRPPKMVTTQRSNGRGQWSQWEIIAGREAQ